MSRYFTFVLMLIFAGVVLQIGCNAKDVIIDDGDIYSFKGDYVGSISFRSGSHATISQDVHWRFGESTYSMWLRGDEALREFCDVSGEYKQGNGFELIPDTARAIGMQICDDSRTPKGRFGSDRSTDTLKLTRYVSEADMMWTIEILEE